MFVNIDEKNMLVFLPIFLDNSDTIRYNIGRYTFDISRETGIISDIDEKSIDFSS